MKVDLSRPTPHTQRMKTPKLRLALLWLCLPLFAFGQEADTGEVVIPSEISEPPYEVGDLVTESGHYIERGEEMPQINLRIVGNKFRLYWIDTNGLIAEPEFAKATVRLTGSVRGRPYHFLQTLPEGAGLGSPGILVPPHLYNAILVLILDDEEAEPTTYSFRYTPELDFETDPTVQSTE